MKAMMPHSLCNGSHLHRNGRPRPSRVNAGRKKRRGAAAVEFAIVAPVFLIMIFGLIEFGRLVMVQQVITNASREGARNGILDGATTSNVQSIVGNYLETAAISGATVTVTPSPPSFTNWSARPRDPENRSR